MKKVFLGEMLMQEGLITAEQHQECLTISKEEGILYGEAAISRGFITQYDMLKMLEFQHGTQMVDLEYVEADPNVVALISVDLAKRNNIVPVKLENDILYVALEDPRNFRVLDEVRIVTRRNIKPLIASKASIERHIERIYAGETAKKAISEYSEEQVDDSGRVVDLSNVDVEGSPIVRLVNNIFERAVYLRASDVHIEPGSLEVRVRMRVDGILSTILTSPPHTLNAIIARIKIIGGLNIAERRASQDGRCNIRLHGKEIDIRISTINTVHGEKAVMRLLDRGTFLIPKDQLGFTPSNMEHFERLLGIPHGIILVTGPTGSGKSTTLYTMLSEINSTRDNITTIEDPVEYMMDGINQMQVNHKAGVSFATGLRAMLRQDPDIIMVGEIRDEETVEIAIRAAITGHLVLSTIHTNDALSTVSRLRDMGVPSYLIAASVVGIISQRLVRRVCPECKVLYQPTSYELDSAGVTTQEAKDIKFYRGSGCVHCSHHGYHGRISTHEIVVLTNDLREMIHKGVGINELRKHASEQGMVQLRDSAMDLVRQGITTLEEISAILTTL